MKCPSYTTDATILFPMEKPETELGVVKRNAQSPRKTGSPEFLPSTNSSTPLEFKTKGPHNKENYQNKRLSLEGLSDDEVIFSSDAHSEDSGYLSHQNSQVEHGDVSNFEDSLERIEENCISSQSKDAEGRSGYCLPMLKFQEDVCKELQKSYKKNKSYDWTVVDKMAENYGLHNVIGRKMGLEFVDILCELLKKDMRHILTQILSQLGDSDLISCKMVSRTWRRIICKDHVALQRSREAERTQRDSYCSIGSLSRDYTLNRVVLSCMQTVGTIPGHKAAKKLQCEKGGAHTPVKSSQFQQFVEAAKTLKQHESLRRCVLCASPAKYDSAMQRAVCTRISCKFQFCTLCQMEFHHSSPCRSTIRASPSSEKIFVGSSRSKRNVRRL
ncbi:hypothetical protein DNTS_004748 [Danionella cerebrum]|uniref:ZBR-type domain-containing protein n=1 Tax=Danionella cerebrum TaxID=2873325 RepID=A0A553R603_9TELE|nr:hypothetical protein DNTS_004748 [Danionella translucida]TRY97618.1 hypothetical protein DNTS_004748 [Danionella translucida]